MTFAAVFVDREHRIIFIHGGKIAHQHGNVSNKLFMFDLNKLPM